jgi:hypothetical protein
MSKSPDSVKFVNTVPISASRRPGRAPLAPSEAALPSDYPPEHLFALSQSLQAYRFYQARTQEREGEIEGLPQQLAERFD